MMEPCRRFFCYAIIVAGAFVALSFPKIVFAVSQFQPLYTPSVISAEDQKTLYDFAYLVLADANNTWRDIFKTQKRTYLPAALSLYKQKKDTPCGTGTYEDGPFYCPRNRTIYIDMKYLYDLKVAQELPGDFALAYVITHEAGHHIQNLHGILSAAQSEAAGLKLREDIVEANLELMADCLSGIWASRQSGSLADQTINRAMDVAQELIERPKSGVVVLKAFEHGTKEQRHAWFKRGYRSGNPGVCNTFVNDSVY